MPISQLTDRCWVLRPLPVAYGGGDRHFDSEAGARDDATGELSAAMPQQLPAACWMASCGECGESPEDEDYGPLIHCGSRADAEDFARGEDWIVTLDGDVYCPEDAPDCSAADLAVTGQVPGQLTIDEVTPGD